MNISPDGIRILVLLRLTETRRRIDAALWAARWPVIAGQLRQMRASAS